MSNMLNNINLFKQVQLPVGQPGVSGAGQVQGVSNPFTAARTELPTYGKQDFNLERPSLDGGGQARTFGGFNQVRDLGIA